jgi:hypothetical protein
VRLQALVSDDGSGIVTVLFDRIDPDILNAFLAMAGSYNLKMNCYVDDIDRTFVGFWGFICVVSLKHIYEWMLPIG